MADQEKDSELTVLDYVRSLFSTGTEHSDAPVGETQAAGVKNPDQEGNLGSAPAEVTKRPFFIFIALVLTAAGQIVLGLGDQASGWVGAGFFVVGGYFILAAWRRQEVALSVSTQVKVNALSLIIQPIWLAPGMISALLAFWLLSTGKWTIMSFLCWAASLVCVLLVIKTNSNFTRPSLLKRAEEIWKEFLRDKLFLAAASIVFITVIIFQFSSLRSTPPEMISAQAEHFYSVLEIHQGNFPLVFPRNVVLEPVNYYWAAFWTWLGGKTLTFTALKAAYALAAMIAIFFSFKLGKLFHDQWTGLAAAGLVGVGLWPIIQSRAVLGGGMVLAVLSAAMYCEFSALTLGKPKRLVVAGILTGLGVMTSKALLVLPAANLIVFVIWLAHSDSRGQRKPQCIAYLTGTLARILTLVPLLRAISLNSSTYLAEILTRTTNAETPILGNPLLVFLNNWLSSLSIVNRFNRSSWVDGIPLRGAVDGITAIFFIIGAAFLVGRYIQARKWQDLALLVCFPVFLIPSAAALAFPNEVPSLSRAFGSALFALLFAAVGLTGVVGSFGNSGTRRGRVLILVISVLIGALITAENRTLIFDKYVSNYTASSWNTSEMGRAIQGFRKGYGTNARIWLIGYPYWVDARVVAIEAEDAGANYALTAAEIPNTAGYTDPQLFLVNPEDDAALTVLRQVYPHGVETTYQSVRQNRNFILFIVPGT